MAAAPTSTSTGVETRSRRAKRARTEANNNWRDWANLTAGPAGLIAEQVLADDIAGYLRFRAVCGSWRRCTPSPHEHGALDSRFHPRRWIMLPQVLAARTSRRRDFLNVSTGQRIRVDLPMLRFQLVLGPTSEGLIALCHKATGEVRLLNPLTKQLATLPGTASLLSSSPQSPYYSNKWRPSTGLRKLKKSAGFSAGLADDGSTVALHVDDDELQLAVAKPGGERWRRRESSITSPLQYIVSALSLANRFYCVDSYSVMAVDVAGQQQQQPQLSTVVKLDKPDFHVGCGVNLVDNDGELLLLRPRRPSEIALTEPYDVHRVDVDAGEMAPVRGLGGRAVFVCDRGAGLGRSLSVHAGLSSSIRANAIYRCRGGRPWMAGGRPRIDVFLVPLDRWIRIDFVPRDSSIVDYLSRYVSGLPLRRRSVRTTVAPLPRKRKGKRKRKANPHVIGNEWVNN